ncbi:hypothetical protein [Lampropedia cohaerens]|uniref:hypothetical protein n=1 Tax=Lampropedia cohaerens TaxID=1610491 RepID=UPI0012E351EC|nr:hypothetical protein [Lampropedia cohaerens]
MQFSSCWLPGFGKFFGYAWLHRLEYSNSKHDVTRSAQSAITPLAEQGPRKVPGWPLFFVSI